MHKRIGILGTSGMIGRHIVDFLSKKCNQLILYSNKDTKQRDIVINQRTFEIKKLVKDDTHPIDLIILSTPEHISKQYAPIFLEKNIPIIDLSSAYRMQDNVPLVVYGIHPTCTTTAACQLIALPNCTVSILARALHPLTQCMSIDRCDVCTYQSVSGAGYNAYLEWKQQKVNKSTNMHIFSFPIADNVIPMIGDVDNNGYTSEEISIINETKKVLHLSDCYISATCVRVSVERGHGIAVSIRCKQEVNIKDIKLT